MFSGHPERSALIGRVPQLQAAVAAAGHQDVLIGFTPRHVKEAVAPLPADVTNTATTLGPPS